MPNLIPVGYNGVQHVLTITASDNPPPCPECGDTPAVLNEIVHDDQSAWLWYVECDHEFVTAKPTLGEDLLRRGV